MGITIDCGVPGQPAVSYRISTLIGAENLSLRDTVKPCRGTTTARDQRVRLAPPGCRFFQTATSFSTTSLFLSSYGTSPRLIAGITGRVVAAARQPEAYRNDLSFDAIPDESHS